MGKAKKGTGREDSRSFAGRLTASERGCVWLASLLPPVRSVSLIVLNKELSCVL
jgi:hypothetical protein